ncbi:MAG: hypothetical protein HY812_10050 [Planctomycetes bacterium]|nr:hypothetical protein [Planctomycetota bacterium]
MKAGIIFTGSGPILVLTSYDSFADSGFIEKLTAKGIRKFIVREIPLELAKARYGQAFAAVLQDVKQNDDLRVLDYDGHRVFNRFSFAEMGERFQHEPP